MVRRLLDIVVSIGALVVLSPLLLAVCLAQKITSPGPVFFLQRRAGRDGAPFWLCKFRTMKVQQAAGASALTTHGDSRITPIGHSLRRWKIDELPQFWNVLKGDMSLVGPRPEMEKFVHRYTPEQRGVLRIRPGLAFRAQLVYPHEPDLLANHSDPERAYVEELMPKKLEADLEYMKERTLMSDFGLVVEILLLVAGVRPRMDTAFRFRDAAPAHRQETA